METKKVTAGILGSTALILGGVDAAILNETPLERVEIIAEERVEAKQTGNVVETAFPWKGEEGLTVKVDLGSPTISERFADKRKKEVITEVVDFGEGGFKVDILLNEKPDTNHFCYQIEGHENYDFFYQPELTKEEIEQGAERPEDIVGSYAVYHKELKDHRVGAENYATGKVMHIPRPQVWELNDEENTKEWAGLSYTDGELCVTVSEDYLAQASYPVRVDPTFGYTSQGSSVNDANVYAGSYFDLTENGDMSSISAYLGYSNSSGGCGPLPAVVGTYSSSLNKLAQGTAQTITPVGDVVNLYTYSVTYSATAGTYGLVVSGNRCEGMGSDVVGISFDTGTSGQGFNRNSGLSYNATMPSTLSPATTNANKHSIYATYTEAADDPAPTQALIMFE